MVRLGGGGELGGIFDQINLKMNRVLLYWFMKFYREFSDLGGSQTKKWSLETPLEF